MSIAPDQAQTTAQQEEPSGVGLENALKAMLHSAKELLDYGRYLAELHWDQIKLKAVHYALLGVVGLVVALMLGTMLLVASVVFVVGLSYSLGHWLFEGPAAPAYGLLLGGTIVLAVLMGLAGLTYMIVQGKFRAQLSKKYDAKKREQRARYGHDVKQRAAVAA